MSEKPEWLEAAGDGLVSTIVTGPQVLPEFARCREELRSLHDRRGFVSVEYRNWNATHVETGRDRASEHMLDCDYNWQIQIDADATFPADVALRLLKTAYGTHPNADMVGAYCQLANPPYLPTIDTGTGRWEEHYPDSGVMPVIRTGTHCFLVKRSAFDKMGPPPWFRSRRTIRPIDALAEVDNIARMNFDGNNPWTDEAWEQLVADARENADAGPAHVGEDSGFCDRLRASGGQILVDTSIVTGHVRRKKVTPSDLEAKMRERKRVPTLACGILEEEP